MTGAGLDLVGLSKPQRAGRPKVKTGCITCKIRRIKCDEKKPACQKCSSTGRKCDGYNHLFVTCGGTRTPQDQSSIFTKAYALPASMSAVFSENPEECRVFDFFRKQSCPSFAGHFSDPFWDSVILRIAHTEPAVKHALIALGSLHEAYIRNGTFNEDWPQGPSYILAPQQYNRAIASLTSDLSSYGSNRDLIVLSVCFLFLCFEVLQGNLLVANLHLQSGLNILQKFQTTSKSSTDEDLEALWHIFSRCDLQACYYVTVRPPLLDYNPGYTPFFGTIREARHCLDEILGAGYYFLKISAEEYRYFPAKDIPSSVSRQRQDLLTLLINWLQKLDILLSNRSSTMSTKNLCAAILLKIHYYTHFIRLSTCLLPQEALSNDAFQLEYTRIISFAESITTTLSSSRSHQLFQFTLDPSIIQPLFITACHCRDGSLRRRAVTLVRNAGREGVWHGPAMAAIAENVIAVEERGAVDGKIPERACVHRTLCRFSMTENRHEVFVKHWIATNDEYTEWVVVNDIVVW